MEDVRPAATWLDLRTSKVIGEGNRCGAPETEKKKLFILFSCFKI